MSSSEEEHSTSSPASCPEGAVSCDGGKCIPDSQMCDGKADCTDGTDEPSTCGKKPLPQLKMGGGGGKTG